ncbi:MAG: AI-2E family transporter [Spartobacteria bacterium]|nr:AI-2E family transporter [Spartobacteria bacterium]
MIGGEKPYTLDRIVRISLGAGLIWGLIWLLGYLSDALIPFAIALLLAYLMNPLVVLVQKKIPHRLTAVLVSLALVSAALTLAGMLLVPRILLEIDNMSRILKDVVTNSDVARRALAYLPPDLWNAFKDYLSSEQVQEFFETEKFRDVVFNFSKKALPGVWGVISGTASVVMWLVGLTVILLYLVFLLLDYPHIKATWKQLLPPQYRAPILGFVEDFSVAMHRYFRGQASIAGLVGIMFAIGFALIGLPMGIVLGLFIGLLNMVPYLQIIGLIPACLFGILKALETGSSIWLMLGLVTLVFVVVQSIQDGILVPRIMGKVTGMSPAIILLSLSVWGKLLGFFGLLLALPMSCILWTYYQRYVLGVRADNTPTPPAEDHPRPVPSAKKKKKAP